MNHLLEASPKAGSLQAEFEEIMRLVGWNKGALAISERGSYYLSRDVQLHFEAFCANKLA